MNKRVTKSDFNRQSSRHDEMFKDAGLKHKSSKVSREYHDFGDVNDYQINHEYRPTKDTDHAAALKKIHGHLTGEGYTHESAGEIHSYESDYHGSVNIGLQDGKIQHVIHSHGASD